MTLGAPTVNRRARFKRASLRSDGAGMPRAHSLAVNCNSGLSSAMYPNRIHADLYTVASSSGTSFSVSGVTLTAVPGVLGHGVP